MRKRHRIDPFSLCVIRGSCFEKSVRKMNSCRCLSNGTSNEDEPHPHCGSVNGAKFASCGFMNGTRNEAVSLNGLRSKIPGVVETDSLTSDILQDLFDDKICVLRVRGYTPAIVCDVLDRFLRDQSSEPYTHDLRDVDGTADLVYFGVNRYGFPLNSTYNGQHLERYLREALPTLRSLRRACAPFLSPIDKFRVEMDEAWTRNVNVAVYGGRKTFCGIGRIMPADLSELSETQPHFDAVPSSYFPQLKKQFTANFYMGVPDSGGELEIWDVPPIAVQRNFVVPDDWRAVLPASLKVKPEKGDLLMFNTRRPHAITRFQGSYPRTSIQTFVGLADNSEVFLWV